MIIPVPAETRGPELPLDIVGQIFTYLDINECYGYTHVVRSVAVRRRIRKMWVACTRFHTVTDSKTDRKVHYANGTVHRIGQPAIEGPGGSYRYVEYGQLHREGGEPALHDHGAESKSEWWVRGRMRHGEADDQFSRTRGTDTRMWLRNGLLHRLTGPALIVATDHEAWYREGKLHREDGPARIFQGIEEWWRNGREHRDGGPAFSFPGGCFWYQNGEFHRDDGPADVSDTAQSWYRHGRLHREDGPAVVYTDGLECWYLNGVFVKQTYSQGDSERSALVAHGASDA